MNNPRPSEAATANRPSLDHFDDEAARSRLLAEVIRKWGAAGAVAYELSDLSDTSHDARDVSYADLGIECDAFVVRFGEDVGLYLDEKQDVFVDRVFVVEQMYEGRDGVFLTIVASRAGRVPELSEETPLIASGWVDADRSVDDGLVHFGLVGDPTILKAKNLFDIEMALGQALARVGAGAKSKPHTSTNYSA